MVSRTSKKFILFGNTGYKLAASKADVEYYCKSRCVYCNSQPGVVFLNYV